MPEREVGNNYKKPQKTNKKNQQPSSTALISINITLDALQQCLKDSKNVPEQFVQGAKKDLNILIMQSEGVLKLFQ